MKQIKVSKENRQRVCWTDEDVKLKAGNKIRFEKESEFWNIEAVYVPSVQKGDIKRDWHVGGL